jgi:hypothetical protein
MIAFWKNLIMSAAFKFVLMSSCGSVAVPVTVWNRPGDAVPR